MIFHLNHLFNPAKRSMHMYNGIQENKNMPLEDTTQAQIFDGIQSIKSRETQFLLPRKTGPLTETSVYIKPPRKYGLHAIVVRFSVKITERITLCTCMSAL